MVQGETEGLDVVEDIKVTELIVEANILSAGVEDTACSLIENVSFVSESVVFVILDKSRLLGQRSKMKESFSVFLSVLRLFTSCFFGCCRYSKLVVLITISIK